MVQIFNTRHDNNHFFKMEGDIYIYRDGSNHEKQRNRSFHSLKHTKLHDTIPMTIIPSLYLRPIEQIRGIRQRYRDGVM